MSTTFGIVIKNGELLELPPQEGGLDISNRLDRDELEIVEVAFRSSYWRWKNPLAPHLPPRTKVYPLDNTPQGIYTIADIINDF